MLPNVPAPKRLALPYLSAIRLTAAEQAYLTHFAKRRLAHFGLDFQLADDLYHQVIYAVLRGVEDETGRKPNPQNLRSKKKFIEYLKGVVNSIVEGWWRTSRTQHKRDHCSFQLVEEFLVVPQKAPIEFQDLQSQLFTRLRQQAHARLLPTINAWEQAPDGLVPCVTSRKHTAAVKVLARQIAQELGFTPGKKKPPGGRPSGSAGAPSAYVTAAAPTDDFTESDFTESPD